MAKVRDFAIRVLRSVFRCLPTSHRRSNRRGSQCEARKGGVNGTPRHMFVPGVCVPVSYQSDLMTNTNKASLIPLRSGIFSPETA